MLSASFALADRGSLPLHHMPANMTAANVVSGIRCFRHESGLLDRLRITYLDLGPQSVSNSQLPKITQFL